MVDMVLLSKIVFFVLLCKVFKGHSASSEKLSITSVKSITRPIGQDVVFMWNITNGRFLEIRFGLLEDGQLKPQLAYMSHGYGPVFGSDLDTSVLRYRGRLSWVGDLSVGHAWFKMVNLTFQDTRTYVAAIQELGTDMLITSSIALTVKGSARFTRVPPKLLRMRAGKSAKLVWDYHVVAKEKEFSDISPIWSHYTSNHGNQRIAFEHRYQGTWVWAISSECPARLLHPTRVRKEATATLVISNVTNADSGVYECSLMLKTGLAIVSKVKLVVTGGPSIEALIRDVETDERSKIKEVPPESPAIVSANTADLSITVNWREPESHGYPVLMYSVHIVELDQAGQEVTSRTYHVNEDVHHYEAGDIEGGKTYRFYVTAWNTHGESVKDHRKSVTVKVQKP
ncbi:uncharacterized protein LOC116307504 [Actinia tenebrosa]|uniref:Uncharacterized protein LOC116307504 n=1 Tax=Actinia tenebrosa TaxID=6105 RepID=A0A6P8J168_ACTTE|nr:uncharacterized protein LOC116307504 [Actinia tenebrosa]XP_031573636.1 uncharacterized protein LOC116307504 [Actinia tenebrosa]